MRVPLADLVQQYHSIQAEVDDAIHRVLESGVFMLGPSVARLEEEVAAACGARYGVAVNSGTDALILALLASGIGPGDEVITSPFTFVATVEAICHVGATPVFADIDDRTFLLRPDDAACRITAKTRAILPVDLFGQMADREAFGKLREQHGLTLVWDSAQAIGARFDDRPLGAFPDCSTLSFFPTKNLGAYGDGGMVLTDNEEVRNLLLQYRFHGSGGGYYYERVGYCSRLDAIQAEIVRVKLGHLAEWNEARRQHARGYACLLEGSCVALPRECPRSRHIFHQYTVLHPRRDGLKAFLKEHDIDSGIYYPLPLHLQVAYGYLGYRRGDLPNAERVSEQVLSIPIHPGLSDAQIQYVADTIRRYDA